MSLWQFAQFPPSIIQFQIVFNHLAIHWKAGIQDGLLFINTNFRLLCKGDFVFYHNDFILVLLHL